MRKGIDSQYSIGEQRYKKNGYVLYTKLRVEHFSF
jgi:hypothetical protein